MIDAGGKMRIQLMTGMGSAVVAQQLDLGNIIGIEDTYSPTVTQTGVASQPSANALTMDSGVVRNITVTFKRFQPEEVNDSLTDDSVTWSNGKWKRAVTALVDRWQMDTDGERLLYIPDDQSLYPPIGNGVLGINGYISSLIPKYTAGQPDCLEGSMTFKVGGMLANYAEYNAVTFWANTSAAPRTNQAVLLGTDVNTTSAIAFPPAWAELVNVNPSTNGQVFAYWTEDIGGNGTAYYPGNQVTADGSVSLYAQFMNGCIIKYNSNAPTGASASGVVYPQAGIAGSSYWSTVIVRENNFTISAYNFTGWNTAADGSGTAYQPGASLAAGAAGTVINLYAQWAINSNYSTYIQIATAEQLQWVGDGQTHSAKVGTSTVSVVFAADAKYLMVNSITFPQTSGNFTPLGSASSPFSGIFDGGGNVIRNMSITAATGQYASEYYGQGLFGITKNATIMNVCILDSSVVTAKNVSSSSLNFISSGMLVGIADSSSSSSHTSISNCAALRCTISYSGSNSGYTYFAGMMVGTVGQYITLTNCNVYDCTISLPSGTPTAGGGKAASVTGNALYGTSTDSSILASLTDVYSQSVSISGKAGFPFSVSAINATNCYYNNISSNNTASGGAVQLSSITKESDYYGFDFASVWYIGNRNEGDINDYALLQKFYGLRSIL